MRASEDFVCAEKLSAAEQIKPDCCRTPAVVSILLTPLPVSCPFTTPHHYTANSNHYCPQSTLAHPYNQQQPLLSSQHWLTHITNSTHYCPQSTLIHPYKQPQQLLSIVNNGSPIQPTSTSITIVHSQHWLTHANTNHCWPQSTLTHANINHCCLQSTLTHPCKHQSLLSSQHWLTCANNSNHYLESETHVSFHCFGKTVSTARVSTWWTLMFLVGRESTVIHLKLKSNHSSCLLSLCQHCSSKSEHLSINQALKKYHMYHCQCHCIHL